MNDQNTNPDVAQAARELLAAVKPADDAAWSTSREFVDVVSTAEEACIEHGPDLARAVIELTAERDAYREENTRLREQAARVKALADRLDAEAADDFDGVSGTSVSLVKYETAKAIRTALNGETRA